MSFFNLDPNLKLNSSFAPQGLLESSLGKFSGGWGVDKSGLGEGMKSGIDKAKGGGGMDPFSIGLGVANLGANIFGGMAQRATQANIANARMAASADALKNRIMEGRNMAKFQEAGAIGQRVFGETAADLDLGRQMQAAKFQAGPLAEMQLAGNMAERRAILGLEGSEEAKALRRRANKQRLKESLAQQQGQMAGMFGRIAPVDVETLFV